MHDIFAVTAPGLEPLAAAELRDMGIESATPVAGAGGVEFRGNLDSVYRANLWLRTASRIIVRMGAFRARSFGEIERCSAQLPWDTFVGAGTRIRLRVTCRKSRLYHSGAVAQRIAGILEKRGAVLSGLARTEDEETPDDAQLVIVRLFRDECTVSADSSGELLHRRGYRKDIGKAPIRETLAAAAVMASGWTPESPLMDPFCGAGTISIEAALVARRIAPGLERRFAFMQWPNYSSSTWDGQVEEARARELPSAPSDLLASDRDAGAVEAARANAVRARVSGDIELRQTALSGIEPPTVTGYLVTNPPYGVRVGQRAALRNLYAQLGNVSRKKLVGWTITFISANADLEGQTRLPLEAVLKTRNGGIGVRVVRALVPGQA
ncbi:MAG: class I SAM-dependent RNA methyltransferase [Gemmatimonadaceae bacterium]